MQKYVHYLCLREYYSLFLTLRVAHSAIPYTISGDRFLDKPSDQRSSA